MLRAILSVLIVLVAGEALAQAPTTMKLCDGTQPNCPLVGAGNPIPVNSSSGGANVTPTNCSGTVVTGGTAVNAFAAGATKHGFTIVNIDTSEPMWISFTGTATAATIGSYPLPAATATTFASPGTFTTPAGMGLNTALSVVAATSGHKFSCTWW